MSAFKGPQTFIQGRRREQGLWELGDLFFLHSSKNYDRLVKVRTMWEPVRKHSISRDQYLPRRLSHDIRRLTRLPIDIEVLSSAALSHFIICSKDIFLTLNLIITTKPIESPTFLIGINSRYLKGYRLVSQNGFTTLLSTNL